MAHNFFQDSEKLARPGETAVADHFDELLPPKIQPARCARCLKRWPFPMVFQVKEPNLLIKDQEMDF